MSRLARPVSWLKAYPSLKAPGPWTRDLLQRTAELKGWIEEDYPQVYWLSGSTYPTGFLTAVLPTTARRHSIPIDQILARDLRLTTAPIKEGGREGGRSVAPTNEMPNVAVRRRPSTRTAGVPGGISAAVVAQRTRRECAGAGPERVRSGRR